jgi:hypothetical protein
MARKINLAQAINAKAEEEKVYEESVERVITFEDKVQMFFDKKKLADRLKKELEPLNREIKKHMDENNLQELELSDYTIKITTQDRSTLNEERVVTRLHELGLEDCILIVEKPNQEAIEKKIYDNEIKATVFEDCTDINIVPVLKVSKKGGK